MSVVIRLATRLYSAMLRLYPISFRQEFGAEMVTVFVEAIVEAEGESSRHLLVTILREFRDIPYPFYANIGTISHIRSQIS